MGQTVPPRYRIPRLATQPRIEVRSLEEAVCFCECKDINGELLEEGQLLEKGMIHCSRGCTLHTVLSRLDREGLEWSEGLEGALNRYKLKCSITTASSKETAVIVTAGKRKAKDECPALSPGGNHVQAFIGRNSVAAVNAVYNTKAPAPQKSSTNKDARTTQVLQHARPTRTELRYNFVN